jgi:YVTN family beta-propeller protein
MAILSTGPIENRPAGGIRPTQQVTVKMTNSDSANSSTVLVQGYHLNGTRTLYVLEVVSLTPNEVATRNYFANFDAFQFVFTTSGLAAESTEISVLGKNASGQLVTAHRLVSDELLGSEVAGEQGPTGGPASTNLIYVANFISNNVSVIDGLTNTVITTILGFSGPFGVGVNP